MDSITLIPPLRNDHHGWLNINGNVWCIEAWHSFDDLGASLETLTVSMRDMKWTVYSHDEGDTFTLTPPL